jgi:hypothetical protein
MLSTEKVLVKFGQIEQKEKQLKLLVVAKLFAILLFSNK